MGKIKFDKRNYRKHNDRNKELIAKSLTECGAGRSILLDADDSLIAGNGVYEQAQKMGIPVRVIETDGSELIAVKRTDIGENDEKRRRLALADNATSDSSEWDFEALKSDISALEMKSWDIVLPEPTDVGGENDSAEVDREKAKSLVERFLVPPFSVFDAKQGYWQARKAAWKAIGLNSGDGRDDNLMKSKRMEDDGNYNILIDNAVGVTTSIFDPVLCEIAYLWFAPSGGRVYDPFAGGSVRGVVAYKLGLDYVGIDLRPEQVEANYNNAEEIGVSPKWICDDSQNVDSHIEDETQDLVFSCPPYFDLEQYSDDDRDLSNMDWDQFLEVYRVIIAKAVRKLKPNRFAVFVVGDVRDRKWFYRDFIGETKRAFIDAGALLYNDAVYLNAISCASLRASVHFNKGRKLEHTHQNVLVFYKGDPKKIHDVFGDVDLPEEYVENISN